MGTVRQEYAKLIMVWARARDFPVAPFRARIATELSRNRCKC